MKLGYISVQLNSTTEKQLSKIIAANNLKPVSEFPFHVTLMFDDRECNEPRCIINEAVIFEATVIGFKVLGDAVVAELFSIGLQKEFQRLEEAGYEHSFPDLLLHMSLVYSPTPFDLIVVEKELGPILKGHTLTFSNETVRDCL